MKKMVFGMLVGAMAISTVVTLGGKRCLKRAKKAMVGKIEEFLK